MIARIIVIIVTALLATLYFAPLGKTDYFERWLAGTYGISLGRLSSAVQSVEPGTPAAAAGVHPGDHVVLRPFSTDYSLLNFPLLGDHRTVRIVQPNGVTRTMSWRAIATPANTLVSRAGSILAILPAFVFLVVAFVLAYARPGIMTWSFYIYAFGYFGTAPPLGWWAHVLPAPAYVTILFILVVVFGNVSAAALLPFVLRFPDGGLDARDRMLDIFAWIFLGAGYVLATLAWFISSTTFSPPGFQPIVDNAVPLIALAAAIVIVLRDYKRTDPAERERFAFLIAGTVVSIAAYAVYFLPGSPAATPIQLVVQNLAVLMPLAIGYAVLRQRVLPIDFVLNRAIVYSGLSVAVLAFVSVLDWLSGKVIGEQRLAVPFELTVTVLIGFLLDRVNRSIGNVVDRVFFRRRHAAEEYLRRAAAALPYATDERAVTEALLYEPVRALSLSAAALYRRRSDGGRLEGVGTSSDTLVAPPGFDENDALVRFLKVEEGPLSLDQLRAASSQQIDDIYVLAIPVLVRHEIAAIALYGAHQNGAQIDPEEVDLLAELAREAARAYDHVDAVAARRLLRMTTQPG